jgi:plastocyanin
MSQRTVPSRFRRTGRSTAAAGLLAVATTLLAACGGNSDAATARSSSSAADTGSMSTTEPMDGSSSTESQTIDVTAMDFSFELGEANFSAGTYEITLTNDGEATHDIRVERDGEDVAESDSVAPGESTTLTVTLEEGEYVFYCSIGNHRAMGMEVPVQVTS